MYSETRTCQNVPQIAGDCTPIVAQLLTGRGVPQISGDCTTIFCGLGAPCLSRIHGIPREVLVVYMVYSCQGSHTDIITPKVPVLGRASFGKISIGRAVQARASTRGRLQVLFVCLLVCTIIPDIIREHLSTWCAVMC